MKKIYSIIALGALISGSITAQQLDNTTKIPFQPKAKVVGPVKNQKTTATTSQGRFDVSYAMPIAHGKTVNTGTVTGPTTFALG